MSSMRTIPNHNFYALQLRHRYTKILSVHSCLISARPSIFFVLLTTPLPFVFHEIIILKLVITHAKCIIELMVYENRSI